MAKSFSALIAALAVTATLATIAAPAQAWSWGETQGGNITQGDNSGSLDLSGIPSGSGR